MSSDEIWSCDASEDTTKCSMSQSLHISGVIKKMRTSDIHVAFFKRKTHSLSNTLLLMFTIIFSLK